MKTAITKVHPLLSPTLSCHERNQTTPCVLTFHNHTLSQKDPKRQGPPRAGRSLEAQEVGGCWVVTGWPADVSRHSCCFTAQQARRDQRVGGTRAREDTSLGICAERLVGAPAGLGPRQSPGRPSTRSETWGAPSVLSPPKRNRCRQSWAEGQNPAACKDWRERQGPVRPAQLEVTLFSAAASGKFSPKTLLGCVSTLDFPTDGSHPSILSVWLRVGAHGGVDVRTRACMRVTHRAQGLHARVGI